MAKFNLDLYYQFPKKEKYVLFVKAYDELTIINGINYYSISGSLEYLDPYGNGKHWRVEYLTLFRSQFEEATGKARSTCIEKLTKWANDNINDTCFQQAKLEAYEKRAEQQKQIVQEVINNLRLQEELLLNYQNELQERKEQC